MRIQLGNVGKRFNSEWIFKNVNFRFEDAGKYAVTGPNGSGKSTFLLLIAGFILHNKGTISYVQNETEISPEKINQYVSLAAPYLEVVEEMTLNEFFHFHFKMKPAIESMDFKEMAEWVDLKDSFHKQIRYYSSGMKQRVKLAQAIFSNVPVILLDEPLTNLDKAGNDMYYRLIEKFAADRLVIVSSNDEREYSFCKEQLKISDFK